jgi:phage terminase large subunit-like protein
MHLDRVKWLKTLTSESEQKALQTLKTGENLSPVDEYKLKLLTIRDFYRNNLYSLCKDLLGYDLLVPHLHHIMCDHVNMVERCDVLFGVARAHYKTTIARALVIQLVLRHPNWSIMVLTSSDLKARDLGDPMRRIFTENKRLREFFPEICPPEGSTLKNWGTQSHFDLPSRTKVDQNHSFMCRSFGSSVSMYHPHVIICDDIVDDKNLGEMKMPKIIETFQLLSPLLDDSEPGAGHMLYIGTRYADDDLQGMLADGKFGRIVSDLEDLTDGDKERGYWLAMHLPATVDGTFTGEPIFPEQFSEQKLARLRDKLDDYIYSCQYLLDPVPQATAKIKQEWFDINPPFVPDMQGKQLRINGIEVSCNIYMTVDPAVSMKKGSDYRAALIAAIDSNRHWFLLDCYRGRKRIEDFYEFVANFAEKWNVQIVAWEGGAIQGQFLKDFKKHVRETARPFRVKELHPQSQGFHLTKKADRIIQSVQPALSQGRVHLAKDVFHGLVQECIRLPKGKHDDLADCFGYMLGWLERPPDEYTPPVIVSDLQAHKEWCIEESLREQEEGEMGAGMEIAWPLSDFA